MSDHQNPGRHRAPTPSVIETRRAARGAEPAGTAPPPTSPPLALAHDAARDHHRQRDHLGPRRACSPSSSARIMIAFTDERRAGDGRLLLLASGRHLRRDLGVGRPAPTPRCSRARSTTSGATGFVAGIRPLTETLTFATPLIAAGLGVGLAFRVGMFNIGGRGQMLIAAAVRRLGRLRAATCRTGIHLIVALLGGLVGGALWGGIVGLLKARTGAHEVIVTIMLNYVAFYLVSFLLRTPGLLQAPGSNNPKTPADEATRAIFPDAARAAVQPALRASSS